MTTIFAAAALPTTGDWSLMVLALAGLSTMFRAARRRLARAVARPV